MNVEKHIDELNLLLELLSNKPQIRESVNQDVFMQLIADHRVISQVAPHIEKLDSNALRERINASHKHNKITQLGLLKALTEIHHCFDGIPFIPLKGPLLSLQLYNDPAERTSRDIDILIDAADIDTAIDRLRALGYECLTHYQSPKQKQAIIRYFHHLEFFHPQHKTLVELHWRMVPFASVDFSFKSTMEHAHLVALGSDSFAVLNKVTQLHYLSVHGCFHQFFRLQWLMDIRALLDHFSEQELEEALQQFPETRRFVLVALGLCAEELNYSFSTTVNSLIRDDKRVKSFVKRCQKDIRSNYSDGRYTIIEGRLEKMLRNHRIHYFGGGMRGLFRNLVARNVRPANWKFFAFPDAVFFLNHLFSRLIWIISKLKS